MFCQRYLLFFIACCTLTCINAQPMLWNIKNIDVIRKDKTSQLYKRIIQKANQFVDASEINITDKNRQFVNDTHYYVSIGTYWWPDTTTAGVRYVRRDGYINPETQKYDRQKLNTFSERLKYLSLAYYLDPQQKYYDTFVKLLRNWFCNNDTYMYPNFEYAQIIPGQNHNRGRAAGLIEARAFNDVLESIRTIELIKKIDRETMSTIKWWFYEFSNWMIYSEIGKDEDKALNNQGIAYDVLLLNIAHFTNQKNVIERITSSFYHRRLKTQIVENGSMPQELERTNALSYSILNLQFIIDFCIIQQRMGLSYYNQYREVIDKAASFLINSLDEKKKWPYSQLTNVENEKTKLECEVLRLSRLNLSYDISNEHSVSSISIDTMLK